MPRPAKKDVLAKIENYGLPLFSLSSPHYYENYLSPRSRDHYSACSVTGGKYFTLPGQQKRSQIVCRNVTIFHRRSEHRTQNRDRCHVEVSRTYTRTRVRVASHRRSQVAYRRQKKLKSYKSALDLCVHVRRSTSVVVRPSTGIHVP